MKVSGAPHKNGYFPGVGFVNCHLRGVADGVALWVLKFDLQILLWLQFGARLNMSHGIFEAI